MKKFLQQLDQGKPKQKVRALQQILLRDSWRYPSYNVFRPYIHHHKPSVVSHALAVLARIIPLPDDMVPEIVPLLSTDRLTILRNALKVMHTLGHNATEAAHHVYPHLEHPNTNIRSLAIQALGAMLPPAVMGVPNIEKLLSDPSRIVIKHTLDALSSAGTHVHFHIPLILKFIHSPKNFAFANAWMALERMGETALPYYLRELGKPGKPILKEFLVNLIDSMRHIKLAALPALVVLLSKSKGILRNDILRTLANMEISALPAFPFLLNHLNSKCYETQSEAAWAMVSMRMGQYGSDYLPWEEFPD